MYFGMAKLVDSPTEVYHSAQWAGSIRTTLGEFVYYPLTTNPVFPGDFEGISDQDRGTHSGQVTAIYRDYRTLRRFGGITLGPEVLVDENSEGDVVLVIGCLWLGKKLLAMNERAKIQITVNPATRADFHDQELVLVLDPQEYVAANNIVSRIESIDFDYSLNSPYSFPDDYKPRAFIPMAKVSPVPGVLEAVEFGRQQMAQIFALYGKKVRSIPILIFADGFGLYRTMYKSIMGVYIIIIALPKGEHGRQINIFPLTFGPHGSNFTDVMKALEPMKALDKVLLCAPVLAFTGDMPQQQANSGMLGVTANKGCRSCEILSTDRGNLEFDITSSIRGHYETLRQRCALNELTTKAAKRKLSSELGLSLEPPALLMDQAFKLQTIVEYARMLRKMPFPPGWAAIQSPYHVLAYSLQEHARWFVLMIVLARCWLREDHLKAPFVRAVRVAFASEIRGGRFGAEPTAVDILIGVLTATVRTNCLLGADKLDAQDRDPANFADTIQRATLSSGPARGTRALSVAASMVSVREDTPATAAIAMPTVEEDVEGDITVGHLPTSQKA
ncbi:hypothetical protein F4808DRAFT_475793 [Astrocystis sublimbata]|nr:hypothetical protein F4808DRAFT_475793 [Astrocystis sublimbata]